METRSIALLVFVLLGEGTSLHDPARPPKESGRRGRRLPLGARGAHVTPGTCARRAVAAALCREPDASHICDSRQCLAFQAGCLAHPNGLEAQGVHVLALGNSSVPLVIGVLAERLERAPRGAADGAFEAPAGVEQLDDLVT